MKKSLTKLLVSCAAVMSVSALMAISASAYSDVVSYSDGTITNGAAVPAASGSQATILVQKATDSALTEDDIVYINQEKYEGTALWSTIATGTLEDGDYVLKMGGEGVTNIVEETFKVGDQGVAGDEKTFTLGDVNMSNAVDAADALLMLQSYAQIEGKVIAEGSNEFKLADIDKNSAVEAADALLALQHYAQIEGKTITETVTVTVPAAE